MQRPSYRSNIFAQCFSISGSGCPATPQTSRRQVSHIIDHSVLYIDAKLWLCSRNVQQCFAYLQLVGKQRVNYTAAWETCRRIPAALICINSWRNQHSIEPRLYANHKTFAHLFSALTAVLFSASSLSFYARQQELLWRVLAIAILSVRPSVCLSHGWIRQKRSSYRSSNLHHRLPQRL